MKWWRLDLDATVVEIQEEAQRGGGTPPIDMVSFSFRIPFPGVQVRSARVRLVLSFMVVSAETAVTPNSLYLLNRFDVTQ
jgi:hypothetical protein